MLTTMNGALKVLAAAQLLCGVALLGATLEARPRIHDGQIERIDGDALVLRTENGPEVFSMRPTTQIVFDSEAAAVSRLVFGQQVRISATKAHDGTFVAKYVQARTSQRSGGS